MYVLRSYSRTFLIAGALLALFFELFSPAILYSQQAFTITRVSTNSSNNQIAAGGARPWLSSDASLVSFWSDNANIDPDCSNAVEHVYVKTVSTGAIECVSTTNGNIAGNNDSSPGVISSNGQSVYFESYATNLVTGDTNTVRDVFVKNLVSGAIVRASTDATGVETNANAGTDYYLRAISGDGTYVVFCSSANNLVTGDANTVNDMFVKNTVTGAITRASTSSTGIEGNSGSCGGDISQDGRYVVYDSSATNLVTGDTNTVTDIFRKDTQTGTTELVSKTAANVLGNGSSDGPSISADGSKVVFMSNASNLAANDTNGTTDVYVKDMNTGTITLVSQNENAVVGDIYSYEPVISGNGRYVVFTSFATNLTSEVLAGQDGIFVKDLITNQLALVNKSASGTLPDNYSEASSISDDGRYIAFSSSASNLVAGDTNGEEDVFLVTNPLWVAPTTSTPSSDPATIAEGDALADTGSNVLFMLCVSIIIVGLGIVLIRNTKATK